MRKSILIRAAIGFVLGMLMLLAICLLFDRGADGKVHFCSDALLKRVGSVTAALLLQLAVCGLYGAACMMGTVFYEIERWSLASATVAHYLVVSLGYSFPALLLDWNLTPRLLLQIEGLMTLGFFLIWLIIYLRYKAQVRELNELMENTRKASDGQSSADAG